MNLAAISIEKRAIVYFGICLIVAGGVFCYLQLGQLEDPEFSVKTAVITTTYPGASARQVELEITDKIETKLQEMAELKNVYSNSRAGSVDHQGRHQKQLLVRPAPSSLGRAAQEGPGRGRLAAARRRQTEGRRRFRQCIRLSPGRQQRRVQLCRIGTLRQGHAQGVERCAGRGPGRPLGSAR